MFHSLLVYSCIQTENGVTHSKSMSMDFNIKVLCNSVNYPAFKYKVMTL
jgi:hypothetical protein